MKHGQKSMGRLHTEYVPIASEERLFFSFGVLYEEPRAAKRTSVECFLCVVVEPLLVWRAVCACHDVLSFVLAELLLQYFGEDFRFTYIFSTLPHCVIDVKEGSNELLLMGLLYTTQSALWK